MILRGVLFLFVSVCLGQSADLKETAGNDILHYLNSNSEQIYRYKNIKSLDILNQENDTYDIKTSIDVECLQDADNPCLTKSFNCEGKLQYRDQSKNFEVATLFCNPDAVEELISEDEIIDATTAEDVTTEDNVSEISTSALAKEDDISESRIPSLQQEADVPESKPQQEPDVPEGKSQQEPGVPESKPQQEPDVPESKPQQEPDVPESKPQQEPDVPESKVSPVQCTGCPIDLDKNVEGVSILLNTALKHLESERDNIQSVIEVVRLQRQIVSGVLFILTVKVAPTTCPKGTLVVTQEACPVVAQAPVEYCTVKYIQKPWISKDKSIISNNCTESQEFTLTKELSTNTIDKNEDEGVKVTNELSPEKIDDMESQIIPQSTKPEPSSGKEEKQPAPTANLPDSVKSFADSFFDNFDAPLVEILETPTTTKGSTISATVRPLKVIPNPNSSEESDEDKSQSKESSEETEGEAQVKVSVVEKRELGKNFKADASEESSGTDETSEEDRRRRSTSEESSEEGTESPESLNSSEEKDKKRNKRNGSSSSSSSSSDDDNDNNNNNDEARKNAKKCNKRDDDSDSSDDSSSDDDDDCDNDRQARSAELSDEQEEILIRNVAEMAAATLDAKDGGSFRHVVLDVENRAKTQLEGTVYNLKVKLARSKCKRTNADFANRDLLKSYVNKKDDECVKGIKNHALKVCDLQVHLTSAYTSPKLLKFECGRSKRDLGPLVGGVYNVSLDDPDVLQLAHNTVALYDGSSSHDNKYKVIEIIWASQQIVAGTSDKFGMKIALSDCQKTDSKPSKDCNRLRCSKDEVCEVSVWSRPWLPDGIKTSVTCENKDTQHYSRSKRSSPLVGGAQTLPTDDPTILNLIEHALTQLDGESTLSEKYKATEIVSATQQVVAGLLYRIDVKIVPSDCLKTDKTDRDQCNIGKEQTPALCHIEIWDRPWLPNGRETNVTCDQATYTYRTRRSVGRPLGRDDLDVQLSIFRDFKDKYSRVYYSKKEEMKRFRIFRKNLAKIQELNANERGTAVYGITKFSDLTYAEFQKRHMGLRTDLHAENEIPHPHAQIPQIQLPMEFDWRTKGVVTEVKDQQQCGSCWAFSVTGNVEGQYAIKHKKLVSLSEQELVDCDKTDSGCNGGLMDNAYREIERIGGLETETDYPYDAEDETCHYNRSLFRVQLSGALDISQNEDDMAKWLVANGPISIAINANAMQFYVGGVSHPLKFLCSPDDLDHGVLIVGYGVHTYPLFKKTLPFWIVKNSWGKSWGEQGYYRVYRGDGTCGLNKTPSSAIVV